MVLILFLLLLLVVAVPVTMVAMRSRRDSAYLGRKKLAVAVERATPGPRREAVRLRVRIFESLEAAKLHARDQDATVGSLLAEAQVMGGQLDHELATLAAEHDDQRIRAQLEPARLRVDGLTAMVQRIEEVGRTRSSALMDNQMQQLQASLEIEKLAQQAGTEGVARLDRDQLSRGLPPAPPVDPAQSTGPADRA